MSKQTPLSKPIWAMGDGQEHSYDPPWDAAEAEALYDLLERQVIPEFYTRGAEGNPHCMGRAYAGKHGAVDTALLRRCGSLEAARILWQR